MNKNQPILEIRQVSKHFSGVYALKQVSMNFYPGQVTAIIGENGAGKSTLMKIVSGVYQDYDGKIIFNGERMTFMNPKAAVDSGIVIIHQELNLIPHLSITENIFLGTELKNKFGFLDYSRMHRKAKELIKRLHLDVSPKTMVNDLRVGQQQLVEIARALLFDSKVLIMDEPTSAISDNEIKLLFQIITELRAKGVSIVYISHKLKKVFEIADRYEVLRDGKNAGYGFIKDTNHNDMIQKMVGRNLSDIYNRNAHQFDEEILRVENLSFRNPEIKTKLLVNNVSFTLHKGEVLGISGLMGAGRSELLEAIFGMHDKLVTGEIYIENKKVSIRNVNDAIKAGLGLVPEDRKLQGLILNMNVAKNISIASLDKISSFNFINKRKEKALSEQYIQKLRTKVSSGKQIVEKLSGGNQQKVVIAKWLATNPKILLLDEPSRGVDVGARAEIYNLIDDLANQGIGIIVVSSELPEILAVSDNIIVLSESKLTGRFTKEEATEEKIMNAAILQ